MGKIKKLIENELIGGKNNSEIYPVTSILAVYDEDNNNLKTVLLNNKKDEIREIYSNVGDNIFNKNTVTKGVFFQTSYPITSDNDAYFITNPIPVEPGTTYTAYGPISSQGGAKSFFLDENWNQISTIDSNTFTTPSNCKFIACSGTLPALETGYIVKEGVNAAYTPFTLDRGNQEELSNIRNNVGNKIDKIIGKNLYDPNDKDILLDSWINFNGGISGYPGFRVSGFIPIKEGQTLKSNKSVGNTYSALYDKNYNYIKDTAVNSNKLTWVEGAEYARFTIAAQNPTFIQIEVGEESTSYEEYSPYTPITDRMKGIETTIEPMTTGNIPILKSKNLFNKDNIIEGKYLVDNGDFLTSSLYGVSEYIPIEPSTTYYCTIWGGNQGGAYGSAFYDENKIFISGSATKDNPITSPENAEYVIICGLLTRVEDAMLEKGDTGSGSYQPYKAVIQDEDLPDYLTALSGNNSNSIVLPSKLHFLKDRQSLIYFDNIQLKEKDAATQVLFTKDSVGKTYGNVFSGTPTSAESGTIDVSVVSSNMSRQSTKINYEVHDSTLFNSETVNILCVGDSFTDIGTWVSEVYQQLTDRGATIKQIGTMGKPSLHTISENQTGGTLKGFIASNAGPARIVNVSGLSAKEFTTGYGADTYRTDNGIEVSVHGYILDEEGNGRLKLSKTGSNSTYLDTFPESGTLTKVPGKGDETIAYTGAIEANHNPFWNPSTGQLDFQYYISLWEFPEPDFLVIQFACNDLATWASTASVNSFIDTIKTVIDKFHSDYPNAKVIFSIEPMGGLLPSDFDADGKLYSVLKFAQALINTFDSDEEYNTWFRISPSYMGVDRYNGYNSSTTTLCERYPDITTKVAGDTVHCNSEGMKQIGDVIVPIIYSFK